MKMLPSFFAFADFARGSIRSVRKPIVPLCLALASPAPAQIIDLYGTVRTTIDDPSQVLTVNVGDPVKVSLALKHPHATEGAALALYSSVSLTLQLGQNAPITISTANARVEVGYSDEGAIDPVWGVSAFGDWKPESVPGVEVGIYTALTSLSDIGNTLAKFPGDLSLETFDLYNGGSLNFRPSGAQIIWSYERYTVTDRPLATAPEPETYGIAGLGLLFAAFIVRRTRARDRSGASRPGPTVKSESSDLLL